MKEKIEKALNKQLNEEFYSFYLYMSMSAYLESINLPGFANWMKVQSEEEFLHARKFYDYIIHAGGRVTLEAIKKPKSEWNSVTEVFEDTYNHEVYITQCINELADLASTEKDHATLSFLKWFIDEQVEEVATAEQYLQELKMIDENKQGLFMLDREMRTRASIIPPLPA